ncbi:hypothetical protein [Mesorhizobium sp. B2-3-4]|uniref:hypothetical protein n=1 Tax=Mesorhizobium sp. B2-3-4 TaxID=2589959 RepID=UPI00112A3F74|nr:hypothetical protein [Mesorhizobium sp. B2-3-4]TPM41404.1 hypothetical protein FJ967_00255 [Mesorhizobium sp. B2-3-4]
MNLNDAFPSNYLKSDDLKGREVKVTIANYKMEKLGDETKLVLFFEGKDKGMVCNKTNANRIAHFYGQNLDGWKGKEILLGTELVDFQGKTTEALRVKGGSKPSSDDGAPFDDSEIPF